MGTSNKSGDQPGLSHSILKVALPVPLRTTFDYLPRAEWTSNQLQPGTRVLVPFGRRQMVGLIESLTNTTDLDLADLKTITKIIDPEPALSPSMLSLCRWVARYYLHPPGEVYGLALPTLLRNQERPMVDVSVTWRLTQKGRLIEINQLNRAKRQRIALEFLREHPAGLQQATLKGFGVLPAHLKGLADKGLVEPHEQSDHSLAPVPADQSAPTTYWDQKHCLAEAPLTLNPQQSQALEAINAANEFRVFTLAGITGSGKTEVYLQAIARCVSLGRQALVLVPEIGLTPQTLDHFKRRFSVPVVAMHSNLTDKERLDHWNLARTGRAAVVLGTRSAMFVASANLGLIVVDEEQDLSYKQQEGLRFNARDLAVVRGQLESIPVVLGSATPSLETWHNSQTGRYKALTLEQRAGNALPPKFKVLDIRQQAVSHGISEPLAAAIDHHLKANQQVLVFINRRGYAPVLMCHDCGWFKECRHCDHRMTFHASPPHLHCHHCNYRCKTPVHCEQCQSTDLRPVGLGTEQVEQHLSAIFPKVPVIRIDRDSTQRKRSMQQHLQQINSGQPCILVGTQMLAKGHHFPKVTLVAICDIDAGLFSVDFRATEHTSQLLLQVAGRSGRGKDPGLVMIQTRQPEHPVFDCLLQQGYFHYAGQMLQERQQLMMPPFSHLALLQAESSKPEAADSFLQQVADWLLPLGTEFATEIWGPTPALMMRKAGRFRFQILLQSQSRPLLHQLLAATVQWLAESAPSTVRWSLDIDPVVME